MMFQKKILKLLTPVALSLGVVSVANAVSDCIPVCPASVIAAIKEFEFNHTKNAYEYVKDYIPDHLKLFNAVIKKSKSGEQDVCYQDVINIFTKQCKKKNDKNECFRIAQLFAGKLSDSSYYYNEQCEYIEQMAVLQDLQDKAEEVCEDEIKLSGGTNIRYYGSSNTEIQAYHTNKTEQVETEYRTRNWFQKEDIEAWNSIHASLVLGIRTDNKYKVGYKSDKDDYIYDRDQTCSVECSYPNMQKRTKDAISCRKPVISKSHFENDYTPLNTVLMDLQDAAQKACFNKVVIQMDYRGWSEYEKNMPAETINLDYLVRTGLNDNNKPKHEWLDKDYLMTRTGTAGTWVSGIKTTKLYDLRLIKKKATCSVECYYPEDGLSVDRNKKLIRCEDAVVKNYTENNTNVPVNTKNVLNKITDVIEDIAQVSSK